MQHVNMSQHSHSKFFLFFFYFWNFKWLWSQSRTHSLIELYNLVRPILILIPFHCKHEGSASFKVCCILFLLHLLIGITGILCFIFSSPGHRPCELLSWVSVRRPSVSFSHLNFLLWNRWTDFNQTCQKCSLDGPLPDLCFWCRFEIQHGCQGP